MSKVWVTEIGVIKEEDNKFLDIFRNKYITDKKVLKKLGFK